MDSKPRYITQQPYRHLPMRLQKKNKNCFFTHTFSKNVVLQKIELVAEAWGYITHLQVARFVSLPQQTKVKVE
eukprot:scaffold34687_cov207-Amphora_coffeaeformis.AAC.3